MQYFLEYGKEFFIGKTDIAGLLYPVLIYLCIFAVLVSAIEGSQDNSRITKWIIQKLGSSKKVCLALLTTFIFFIIKLYFNVQILHYADEVRIFEDEAQLFATCFGCTLLFISSLMLLYIRSIITKLQWKKWISIPIFIAVQLTIFFFAAASLNWESDYKYGDIKTSYLDEKNKEMQNFYDYEIIINTEDKFFSRDLIPFTKKTSINLLVQRDSVCLIGQEEIQSLFPKIERVSATHGSSVCKWFVKESKEWQGVKKLFQDIRTYKQEYFIGREPLYSAFTEVILLDYKNITQKRLVLPFAHERVPKASEILNTAQFYIDSWEQFKPQSVENSQNTEESDK